MMPVLSENSIPRAPARLQARVRWQRPRTSPREPPRSSDRQHHQGRDTHTAPKATHRIADLDGVHLCAREADAATVAASWLQPMNPEYGILGDDHGAPAFYSSQMPHPDLLAHMHLAGW